MEELLSLKWNNHRTSFVHQLSRLRKKSTYTDVTLACDGKLYNVHKMVLSACSDYFSHIFDNISCPNPVIVLKDMSASHLESLLDYMYLGEVNVRQVDLASLIQAAECLKLKGLAVPDNDMPEKSDSRKRSLESPSSVRKKPRRTTLKVTPASDDTFEEPPISTPSSMKTEDIVTIKEEPPTSDIKDCTETWDYMPDPDPDPIDFDQNEQPTEDLNLYNEMTSPFETDNFDEGEETNTEIPPNYDQASQPSSSNAHRRKAVTAAVSLKRHRCTYCSKSFKRSTDLQRHIRVHTGEKPFHCQFCPFKARQKGNLASHQALIHSERYA